MVCGLGIELCFYSCTHVTHVLHTYTYVHVRACTFLAGVTVCTEPGSMPSTHTNVHNMCIGPV